MIDSFCQAKPILRHLETKCIERSLKSLKFILYISQTLHGTAICTYIQVVAFWGCSRSCLGIQYLYTTQFCFSVFRSESANPSGTAHGAHRSAPIEVLPLRSAALRNLRIPKPKVPSIAVLKESVETFHFTVMSWFATGDRMWVCLNIKLLRSTRRYSQCCPSARLVTLGNARHKGIVPHS